MGEAHVKKEVDGSAEVKQWHARIDELEARIAELEQRLKDTSQHADECRKEALDALQKNSFERNLRAQAEEYGKVCLTELDGVRAVLLEVEQLVLPNHPGAGHAALMEELRAWERHADANIANADRANKAEAERNELRAALEKLRTETKGMIGAFGIDIKPIVGNTNWSVLQLRIKEADEALGVPSITEDDEALASHPAGPVTGATIDLKNLPRRTPKIRDLGPRATGASQPEASEEKLCFRCNRPDHDGMCETGPTDTERLDWMEEQLPPLYDWVLQYQDALIYLPAVMEARLKDDAPRHKTIRALIDAAIAAQPAEEPDEKDCPDCIASKKHAWSDATTPGFFFEQCPKHRKAEESNDAKG